MVAHVRPNEKDKMQNGMEYACLYFNRGSDESFNIEFYDKNANRKTDLMRVFLMPMCCTKWDNKAGNISMGQVMVKG